MDVSVPQAAHCFIVCHGGPADHLATCAQNLSSHCKVDIYASGPALKKFQERGVEVKHPFSVENLSVEEEDALAEQIAKACSIYSVVMTDVGHAFDIKVQKALACYAGHVRRLAWYDNPEPYVPGGYSKIASQVMLAAQGALFANAHLATDTLFQEPGKKIEFGSIERAGIGYYPVNHAENMALRRVTEHSANRAKLFADNHLIDNGQKLLVYFGGNNEEYFGKAFPAFLSLLAEGMQHIDLSHTVIVMQQHPGAKGKNVDANMLAAWINQYGQMANAPKMLLSDFSSDDAQIVADCALYYQTSMGPQFKLAGIPTVQIGHEVYPDILVKNKLSPSVTNVDQLLKVLESLASQQAEMCSDVILESLGIKANWLERLRKALMA